MEHLLDYLRREYNLPSDAALAEAMEVSPPVISKLRNGHTNLTASMMLRIHDVFGISIANIKRIAYGV